MSDDKKIRVITTNTVKLPIAPEAPPRRSVILTTNPSRKGKRLLTTSDPGAMEAAKESIRRSQ